MTLFSNPCAYFENCRYLKNVKNTNVFVKLQEKKLKPFLKANEIEI